MGDVALHPVQQRLKSLVVSERIQIGIVLDPFLVAIALVHRSFEWIEYQALKYCERAVFTAPGALRLYADRYPDIPVSRLTVIENGYDESAFSEVVRTDEPGGPAGRPLVLVHSGTIYPSERDPRPFFGALAQLHRNGAIKPGDLKVVLRATGSDDYLRGLVGNCELDAAFAGVDD